MDSLSYSGSISCIGNNKMTNKIHKILQSKNNNNKIKKLETSINNRFIGLYEDNTLLNFNVVVNLPKNFYKSQAMI